MDTKGVDSQKVCVSSPQSSKAVFMNTVKKSRLTESTLSCISLFVNTGSVLFLLDFYRDFNGPWNFLGLKSPTLVLVYELLAFIWQWQGQDNDIFIFFCSVQNSDMTVAVSLAHCVIICKEDEDLSSLFTVGILYKIVVVISKKNVYNIYRVPQCKYPRRNWDSPTPSLASECAPPPGTKGVGRLSCGWGGGGVPIPTTGEKLSTLPTLW